MQMQGANRHAVHSVFEDEDVVIKFLCLFMHIFNFKCFQVHGLSDGPVRMRIADADT